MHRKTERLGNKKINSKSVSFGSHPHRGHWFDWMHGNLLEIEFKTTFRIFFQVELFFKIIKLKFK